MIENLFATIKLLSWFQFLIRWLIKAIKWFFIISVVSVIFFRFFPVPITPYMIFNLPTQMLEENRKFRIKKDWVSIDEMSSYLPKAVMATEDQKFYDHWGCDVEAIQKAIQNNEKGKRIKGGSTISQQTAKNVFLLHHRSYIRKGLEAYFTILIELFWSKERILEVYLNVIEFGDGIYGVQAASKHFFNKNAKDITRNEAALLAVVLPNPLKYKVDRPSGYVLKRKKWCVRQIKYTR